MENLSSFSWIDLVLALAVVLLGLKGLINGLVREFFGLFGLVGGVIFASRFNGDAALLINEYVYKFDRPAMADFVGFLAVFLLVWIISLMLGAFFSKLLKLSGLGFLDRLGGFVVGGAKIFLVFCIFVAVISRISFISEVAKPTLEKAYSYPFLLKCGAWVLNMDIAALNEKVQNTILEQTMNNDAKENTQEENNNQSKEN